jgi:hypothetical protein
MAIFDKILDNVFPEKILPKIFDTDVTPPPVGGEFIMEIDTTKPGTSTNTDFQLPIYNTGNYDFTVNWGDGNIEQITSDAILVHSYAVAGVYEIRISGTIEGFATFGSGDPSKILEIKQWGPLKFGRQFWQLVPRLLKPNYYSDRHSRFDRDYTIPEHFYKL